MEILNGIEKTASAKKDMKRGVTILTLWTLVLLVLLLAPIGSIPVTQSLLWFQHTDKVFHFGLFFITGIVSVYSVSFLSKFRSRVLFGAAFGLFLAVCTELVQSLIPFRSMSLYDLIANVAGLGAALGLCALLCLRRFLASFFGTRAAK